MGMIRSRRSRGFTLIELLVVVTIIGILAAILLANFRRAFCKGREGRTYACLSTMRTAVNAASLLTPEDYLPPGGNNTQGYPWTLKTGGWASPIPGGESWAGDDNQGWVTSDTLSKHIGVIPVVEVGNNCKLSSYGDGFSQTTNGIWQTNFYPDAAASNPGGNYRGWHYRNTDGKVRINNTSLSTEGKKYSSY